MGGSLDLCHSLANPVHKHLRVGLGFCPLNVLVSVFLVSPHMCLLHDVCSGILVRWHFCRLCASFPPLFSMFLPLSECKRQHKGLTINPPSPKGCDINRHTALHSGVSAFHKTCFTLNTLSHKRRLKSTDFFLLSFFLFLSVETDQMSECF